MHQHCNKHIMIRRKHVRNLYIIHYMIFFSLQLQKILVVIIKLYRFKLTVLNRNIDRNENKLICLDAFFLLVKSCNTQIVQFYDVYRHDKFFYKAKITLRSNFDAHKRSANFSCRRRGDKGGRNEVQLCRLSPALKFKCALQSIS